MPALSQLEDLDIQLLDTVPYGGIKTNEADIDFKIDPSFGLTRLRYAWFSNDVRFDRSFFTETGGAIRMETTATGTDTARIRSAYPGQYISHTIAQPGLGCVIPASNIERDSNNLTSITHGEISVELVEWDRANSTGVNAFGLSFESDATYVQVRKDNTDIEFVAQENWNIDPLDGNGPSGKILKPENGLIYNFPFTWYGEGDLVVAIQTSDTQELIPVHRFNAIGETSLATPNLPMQVSMENQGTADSLSIELGGMQWMRYGSASLDKEEFGRQTKVTRRTTDKYIDTAVVTSNNAIDPFAEPGRPLVSIRRDQSQLTSRVALSIQTLDTFIASAGDLYLFVFDEYDAVNALTNQNFREPVSQQFDEETNIEVDTEATDYTPGANAVLRSLLFVEADKNTPTQVSGSATARLPIDATTIFSAVKAQGANDTFAQPAITTVKEGY